MWFLVGQDHAPVGEPAPGDYGQLFLLDENIRLSALLKSFRNMKLGGSLGG